MSDIDKQRLKDLLRNAYIELCKAEKLLKQQGCDKDGK